MLEPWYTAVIPAATHGSLMVVAHVSATMLYFSTVAVGDARGLGAPAMAYISEDPSDAAASLTRAVGSGFLDVHESACT
jgi:hypothetical protein